MIERLRAEEALSQANAMALGAGAMKPAIAVRYVASLMRAANGGARMVPPPPSAIVLAAMGVEIVEVPSRAVQPPLEEPSNG